MPAFNDAEHLYATMRALFNRLETLDRDASAPLLRSRLIIQLATSHPDALVTLDASNNHLQRHFGQSPVQPQLTIRLDGDTLDKILSGRLPLTKALGQKSVQVKGPIWKSMPLADLFRRSQEVYSAVRDDVAAG